MKGVFGDNLRDTIATLKPPKKKQKVEFPMCGHPELYSTQWNQPKPEAVRSIGTCPLHDYCCPVCGFGAGSYPSCECSEMR